MSIYEQHDKAFSRVSAWVLMFNGASVGRVSMKFPADGAGRLTCFAHIFCTEMAKGTASGYGYDKGSAAAEKAFAAIPLVKGTEAVRDTTGFAHVERAQNALALMSGRDWKNRLEDAGFVVLQAV